MIKKHKHSSSIYLELCDLVISQHETLLQLDKKIVKTRAKMIEAIKLERDYYSKLPKAE